jgi:hypothetical protein
MGGIGWDVYPLTSGCVDNRSGGNRLTLSRAGVRLEVLGCAPFCTPYFLFSLIPFFIYLEGLETPSC